MKKGENLREALLRAIGTRDEDFKKAQVTREQVDCLGNIYIKEQHQIHMIVDVLVSYPSLIRNLADWNDVQDIVLASAHNQIKPVLKREGESVYIECN